MKPRAEIIAGVPADAAPGLWFLLMVAALFLWAAWLDYLQDVGGPKQHQRATRSLYVMIAFGLSTATGAAVLQMWAQP